MQIGLGVLLLLVAIIGYWGFLRRRGGGESLGRRLAARTWGSAAPPPGGAAVASPTHRQSRAPAPKVAQPVEGRLLTGWLLALVRLIHRHRCPSPLGEPPSDENGPGARMRSELFCGRGP
jgi:hypothetical protein